MRRTPLPPTSVADQPTFPCCKYTTAHDLGTLLVSLSAGRDRPRPGAAAGHHGARGARRALAAPPRGLSRGSCGPSSPFPVGHKAGWLPDMQHDAALVFTPRGTIVAVFMNYSPGGVSYTRVRDADGEIVKLALRS